MGQKRKKEILVEAIDMEGNIYHHSPAHLFFSIENPDLREQLRP